MSKKSIFSVLLLAVFLIQSEPTMEATPVCGFDSCHIERSPVRRISASLVFDICPTISEEVSHWIVYVPDVPCLDRQKSAETILKVDNLTGNSTNELSSLGRRVLKIEVSADKRYLHKLPVRTTISATLYKTTLESGKTSFASCLSSNEVQENLKSTISMDYHEPVFQDFLRNNNFSKQQDESDICFAWRVFGNLRTKYQYQWKQQMDRRASKTCLLNATDCGGLSYLYCAILRANGIPARPLIGRWARSSNPIGEDYSGSYASHVKSEFFTKLGWVPADLSKAVANKSTRVERFFANDDGDFLVMHVNPDLVLLGLDGPKEVRSMPDFRWWVGGNLNNQELNRSIPRKIIWKVSEQPLE